MLAQFKVPLISQDVKFALNSACGCFASIALTQSIPMMIDPNGTFSKIAAIPIATLGGMQGAMHALTATQIMANTAAFLGGVGYLSNCPSLMAISASAGLGMLAGRIVQKVDVSGKFTFVQGLVAATLVSVPVSWTFGKAVNVIVPSFIGAVVSGITRKQSYR
ncbi:MAG: hypothetical protein COT85_01905 [Chlamydiae bacterium CG10_big_fil_rev_8_21_14_0_10_42_34]|nr:MAG: hypothetical protein COT85_01905 [Chlamydiae bacterium CG10_big_fil_rev_8_21_14_0_10_42_34]